MGSAFFRIILLCLIILNGITISHAEDKTATSILLFGDSIIAGYGLTTQHSLPVQLENFFAKRGQNIKIINGGVSGDTTSSGLSRLDWTIEKNKPDIVFIALGGNDVLRGLPPAVTRQNLDTMIAKLQEEKIPVILSAVQAPVNLGVKYTQNFRKIYPDLADKYNIPLYPFLLVKTFGNHLLMQNDNIHPNTQGIKVIVEDLGPYLLEQLKEK